MGLLCGRKEKTVTRILVALALLAILFRNSIAGPCFLFILIECLQYFLFNRFASSDLSKTFQEDGKHVKGWR